MPRAELDLEAIYLYIRAASSPSAERWFSRLVLAIESLANHPQRSPVTAEDPNLRHLLFGNKPHVYRIIYSVIPASQRVDILHVRHGARKPFPSSDVSR